MSLGHSPSIVTSGLILCLDAANAKSYPKSGTLWSDLSGNANAGTLVNGPTFDSANGGSLVFNGTNQYATIASSSTFATPQSTIELWIKTNTIAVLYQFLYGKSGYPKFYLNYGNLAHYNGTLYTDSSITANSWNQVGIVFSTTATSFYINGSITTSIGAYTLSSTVESAFIGKDSATNTQFFSGNISVVKVYNRALSATEISTNFNAMRGRYGL